MKDEEFQKLSKDVEMLLKLRILEMSEKGYSQAQLAEVLGISQSSISRLVPKVAVKKKNRSL